MTTHTAVFAGGAVRHLVRRAVPVAPARTPRADVAFGELGNPSLRPRASQLASRRAVGVTP